MKKTLRKIAALRSAPTPIDLASALRWHTRSHGYFAPDGAAEAAFTALQALHSCPERAEPELMQRFINQADAQTPAVIAIEGLDGSGKTLQANALYEALAQAGKRAYLVDFPQYNGFFGREIGALLSGSGAMSAMELDARSMSLWYAMDRWKTLHDVSIDEYDYIIFNRYTLANVAYQSARTAGALDRELADWVFRLEHEELGLPVPDLYVYLDTDSSFTGENVLKKGQRDYTSGLDVYESSAALQDICHSVYRQLSRELPSVWRIPCMAADGSMKSVKSISNALMDLLRELELIDF